MLCHIKWLRFAGEMAFEGWQFKQDEERW